MRFDARFLVEYNVDSYPHYQVNLMKTIQMTIEENLLSEVDEMIEALQTTRSAFIRDALRAAIKKYKIRQMEEQHRLGYEKYPVQPGEFDVWYDEQAWGDE